MKWNTARPWLGTVLRLVLGVVWIWAAWEKLKSPRDFVQAVRAYDATPEWLSQAIGYGLPVLELCIGIVLIVGVAVRLAAIASVVLFVVFLIGIVQASARGISLDCGCFGGGGTTEGGTTYTLDILRDIGLGILAAFLVYWPRTRISLDEFISRHDQVATPSAKRLRSDQGRRKYNALLESRKRAARSRDRYISGSLAGVIVLVSIIGIGVQSGRAKIAGSLVAKNVSVTNGVVFGKKAAATVDVYEDFQCPNCREYEDRVGATMEAAVRANKAQVRYHAIAFLDSGSNGNRYSSRAANAAYCAAEISVDAFYRLHKVLYGKIGGKQVQPDEGTNGRTNDDLLSYAKAAQITGSDLTNFTGCVESEKHKALVEAITERSSKDGVSGTPTVLVNGKPIGLTEKDFTAAVTKALKKGPKPDPSTTPAASVTPSAPATTKSPSVGTSKTASTVPSKSAATSTSKTP
ncbi:MAG: MauE/DoxX family redox-associated membrane protein [Jatrophihabitans sp.]